jgi:hypothetical protein
MAKAPQEDTSVQPGPGGTYVCPDCGTAMTTNAGLAAIKAAHKTQCEA